MRRLIQLEMQIRKQLTNSHSKVAPLAGSSSTRPKNKQETTSFAKSELLIQCSMAVTSIQVKCAHKNLKCDERQEWGSGSTEIACLAPQATCTMFLYEFLMSLSTFWEHFNLLLQEVRNENRRHLTVETVSVVLQMKLSHESLKLRKTSCQMNQK